MIRWWIQVAITLFFFTTTKNTQAKTTPIQSRKIPQWINGKYTSAHTITGAQRIATDAKLAKKITKGEPTAILAHAASVLPDMTHIVDALHDSGSGVKLISVLAPEHGFRGAKQAGHGDGKNGYIDRKTGLSVTSVYNLKPDVIAQVLRNKGVKVVLVDLQDCGTRFYTYIWTAYDLLVAAASTTGSGSPIRIVILDRPNPLGGINPLGPVLDSRFSSAVGKKPLPIKHSLTIGELSVLFNEEYVPSEEGSHHQGADLSIIEMQNWDRNMTFPDTGLAWIPPSPNLPTFQTAFLYLGMGLIEGTNLSEGRGTTLPFELIGAPFIDWNLADALKREQLEVDFREAYFVPTFSKFANQTLGGVQVIGNGVNNIDMLKVALNLIKKAHDLYPKGFQWVKSGAQYWLDLLAGTDTIRLGIEEGLSVDQMVSQWQEELEWFKAISQKYKLYA